MNNILLVGAGSFIGGICRYLMAQAVQLRFFTVFPYGTLSVNITGCFIIGVIYGMTEKFHLAPEWRLLLATGICGGFTTFSAFSFETISLLKDGQMLYGFVYIGSSIIAGLLATIS